MFFRLISLLLLFSTPALASEGGVHLGIGMVYSSINFIIFLFGIIFLLRKPVKEYFQTRSILLRQQVESSKIAHEKILKENQEIQAKLAKLDSERDALIASFKEEGESERKKIVAEAKALASRMKEDASKMADFELRRAKEDLKRTTIQLATDLAEKSIRSEIDAKDEERLVRSFVAGMKGAQS